MNHSYHRHSNDYEAFELSSPLPRNEGDNNDDEDDDETDATAANGDMMTTTTAATHALHLHHPVEAEGSGSSSWSSSSTTGELAGIYLGILNLFTTLPQFVGTFISAIVFAILEPGKSPELAQEAHPDEHHSTDGPNAIAVCLFIGALSTLGAAYATTRLRHVY